MVLSASSSCDGADGHRPILSISFLQMQRRQLSRNSNMCRETTKPVQPPQLAVAKGIMGDNRRGASIDPDYLMTNVLSFEIGF